MDSKDVIAILEHLESADEDEIIGIMGTWYNNLYDDFVTAMKIAIEAVQKNYN